MFSQKVNCILISLLVGLACIHGTLAQDEQKSPEDINSGFVFVDWKYLEAPYKVEERDLAIYINGVQVTREDEVEPFKKCCFDYDPGMPEGITKEATIDSIYQEPKVPGGRSFLSAKMGYLFSHFSSKEAYEKAIECYRSFPCVKRLEQDETGWLLEGYDGTKSYIDIAGPAMYYVNRIYGPGGTGPQPRELNEKRVEERMTWLKDALKDNKCLFMITPSMRHPYEEVQAANLLPEVVAVLKSDTLSGEEKKGELVSLGILQRGSSKTFQIDYSNFEANNQLEERIAALREMVKKKYGPDALHPVERDWDLKYRQKTRQAKEEYLRKKLKNGDEKVRASPYSPAYSPDGVDPIGWCGYTYDYALTGFAGRVQQIKSYLKDQDYFFPGDWTFVDTHGGDGDCEECTYAHFKDMQYGDFLYLEGHGTSLGPCPCFPPCNRVDGIIGIVRLETEVQVNNWSGNDPLILPYKAIDYYGQWPSGYYWAATAKAIWASTYWHSQLTASNAIVILSTCHSHQNGWAAACGSGVAFGYYCHPTAAEVAYNNRELLMRMNGSINDYGIRFRKAGDAYNAIPHSSLDDFRIVPPGANITLCPSYESKFPRGSTGNSGIGYFQVDTYCHDTVSANQALTFTTSGSVTVSNIHWVGTGKVRRIEFNWNGSGSWIVWATAHADKFHSWGTSVTPYHKLDGNCQTPNGDNVRWYFQGAGSKGYKYFEDDFSDGPSRFWKLKNTASSGGYLNVEGIAARPYSVINEQYVESKFILDSQSRFQLVLQSSDKIDHFGLFIDENNSRIEYSEGGAVKSFPFDSNVLKPGTLYKLTLRVDENGGNAVTLIEYGPKKVVCRQQYKMSPKKAWGFNASVQSGDLRLKNYSEVCSRRGEDTLTPKENFNLIYPTSKVNTLGNASFHDDFTKNSSSAYLRFFGDECSFEYNTNGFLELVSPLLNANDYTLLVVPQAYRGGKLSVDFSLAEFNTSAFEIYLSASSDKHPALDRSYYIHLFDWGRKGYCGIYAVENRQHTLIDLLEDLPPMQLNVWHTAELEVNGEELSFFLDGKHYYRLKDAKISDLDNVAFGAKHGRVSIDNICFETLNNVVKLNEVQ